MVIEAKRTANVQFAVETLLVPEDELKRIIAAGKARIELDPEGFLLVDDAGRELATIKDPDEQDWEWSVIAWRDR